MDIKYDVRILCPKKEAEVERSANAFIYQIAKKQGLDLNNLM